MSDPELRQALTYAATHYPRWVNEADSAQVQEFRQLVAKLHKLCTQGRNLARWRIDAGAALRDLEALRDRIAA